MWVQKTLWEVARLSDRISGLGLHNSLGFENHVILKAAVEALASAGPWAALVKRWRELLLLLEISSDPVGQAHTLRWKQLCI